MSKNIYTIKKPVLKGSQKQIKWADDIIDKMINAAGTIEIPANAPEEQVVAFRAMMDKFFSETEAWKWIERYGYKNFKDFNSVAVEVKLGWSF